MKPRLQQLITHLQQGLIERDTPTRLALLAALAGEHLLLLGPPGTAKSELARRLQRVFTGGAYFERLLTQFSVPEELFGPLSISALEQDRYQRLTDGYLPSASIAFIDEIFKANSAILNALLTLLNEREFDNGNQRLATPLIAVIGASNELPEGEELAALYDRFLLRYRVEGVSEAGFAALLELNDSQPAALDKGLALSPEELAEIRSAADKLPLDAEVLHLLASLRTQLREQGRHISDRRWRKLVKLLRVAALTDGRERVSVWDCWLLQHGLWDEPEQRAAILDSYQQQLGTDAVLNPARLTRLTRTWEATLAAERDATRPLRNVHGDPLYLDPQGRETIAVCSHVAQTRDGEPLYLAPPDEAKRDNDGTGYSREELQSAFFDDHYQQCHIDGRWVTLDDYVRQRDNRLLRRIEHRPCTEPVCYAPSHIESRVAEASELLDSVQRYHESVRAKLDELERTVVDHLWLDDDFAAPARDKLQQSLAVAEELATRIEALREGFAGLPKRVAPIGEQAVND